MTGLRPETLNIPSSVLLCVVHKAGAVGLQHSGGSTAILGPVVKILLCEFYVFLYEQLAVWKKSSIHGTVWFK